MSIYTIDQNLPTTTKLELLNEQILEVNGKTAKGIFNKYEIDELYTQLALNRKYIQNVELGHTLADYTKWTCVRAESGYSIWKYTQSDYVYSAFNELYLDDILLDFRGQATAETANAFDSVLYYDSGLSAYIDDTTEASTETGTEFDVELSTATDFLYCGLSATFGGCSFEFQSRGSNYTLKVEYFNGAWTELTANLNALEDNTSDFASDGAITWTIPSNWTMTSINGTLKYWIRISSTTIPVTTAKIYNLIPYNSVPALLSMSSSQLQKEEWAWCSFGTSIYVAIRNTGNAAYEGDYFVSSSSSVANKINFFVYNHLYSLNYRSSTYSEDSINVESGVAIGDLVYVSDQYTFNLADADSYAKRAIGVLQSAGTVKLSSGLIRNVNTVGAGNIIPGDVLYLSGTSGKVTRTAPSGAGKIQQRVGTAIAYESSGSMVDMIMNIEAYPTILS